jgi:hypothetical protein
MCIYVIYFVFNYTKQLFQIRTYFYPQKLQPKTNTLNWFKILSGKLAVIEMEKRERGCEETINWRYRHLTGSPNPTPRTPTRIMNIWMLLCILQNYAPKPLITNLDCYRFHT